MSDRKPENQDDTDDLAVLLDDLNTTLSALEEAVDDEQQSSSSRSSQTSRDRNSASRDSSVQRRDGAQTDNRSEDDGGSSIGNVFRFTEEYTLPALISILETTIESLELLRGVLRFVDPEQSAFRDRSQTQNRRRRGKSPRRDPVSTVGREALSGLDRALSEIEETLAADNDQSLPSDRIPRDLLADARDLSAEVADRLGDVQNRPDRRRQRDTRELPRNRPDDTTRQERQRSQDSNNTAEQRQNEGAVTIDVDAPRKNANNDDGENKASTDTHSDVTMMDNNTASNSESVNVDVESELASIKDTVDPDERFIDTDADADADSDADADNNTDSSDDDNSGDRQSE